MAPAGESVIIGANGYDVVGNIGAGRVYLYNASNTTPVNWTSAASDQFDGNSINDALGTSVSYSSSADIIVGGTFRNGSQYYQRTNGTWSGSMSVNLPNFPDFQVSTISADGTTIAIGSLLASQTNASGTTLQNAGVVKVFDISCTPPTITLGTSPTVCAPSNTQTVALPYTATTNLTGTTNTYTVDYDAAAEAAGLADITTATSFTASANGGSGSIDLTVPANTAAGTYNGTITVSNAPGCSSSATAFTITVNPNPTQPTVTDNGPICAGENAVFTITGDDTDVFTYRINNGPQETITIGAVTPGTATVTVIAPTTAPTFTQLGVTNTEGCTTPILGITSTVAINETPTVANVTGRSTCSSVRLDDNGTTLLPTMSTNGLAIGGESDAWVITNIAPAAGLVYVSGDNVGDVPVTTTDEDRLDNDVWNNPTAGPLDIVYTVVPTADNGCAGDPFTVTVTVKSAPNATIAVDDADVCVGDTDPVISFELVGGTAPATINYTIDDGMVATPTPTSASTGSNGSTTINQSTTTAGTYTYKITSITDGANCTTTFTASNQPTISVTVAPNPTLTSVTPTPACVGSDATMTVGGLPTSGTYAVDYDIDGGTTVTATGVSPDANGEGTFTIPAASILTANSALLTITRIAEETTGCETTITDVDTRLIVNSVPTLGSTAASTATATICADESITVELTGLLTYADQTVEYTIDGVAQAPAMISTNDDPNGPPVSTASFDTDDVAAALNGKDIVITKITADDTGCFSDITTNNTLTIAINPSPTLTGISVADICTGGTLTAMLTGLPADTEVLVNYLFQSASVSNPSSTPGNTPNSGIRQATVTANASGDASFTFTSDVASDALLVLLVRNTVTNCFTNFSSSTTSPIDFTTTTTSTLTAPFTVNPLPTATISGPATACVGDTPQVTFTGATGTAPYTFTYAVDGGTPTTTSSTGGSSTASVSVTAAQAGSTTYALTKVVDNKGCEMNITGQSVTITVNDVPVGGQAVSDATICAGTATTVTVTGATEGLSYQLQDGSGNTIGTAVNGPVGGGDIDLAIPAGTAGGTLAVVASNSNNCSTTLADTPVLTVNDLPLLPIAVPTSVCYFASVGVVYPSGMATPNTSYVFLDSNEDEVSTTISVGPNGIFAGGLTLDAGAISPGDNQVLTLQVTNTLTGCVATMDYTIDVLPPPTLSGTTLAPICAGEDGSLVLNGLVAGADVSVQVTIVPENNGNDVISTFTVPVAAGSTTATVSVANLANGDEVYVSEISFAGVTSGLTCSLPLNRGGTATVYSGVATVNTAVVNAVPTLGSTAQLGGESCQGSPPR